MRCFRPLPALAFITLMAIALGLILGSCGNSSHPSREIINLRALARLYGYVRWFHPSDEAQEIDWDRFAVYAVARIRSAEDNADLEERLRELFLPLAPTLLLYDSSRTPPDRVEAKEGDPPELSVVAWQHLGVGLGNPGPYRSIRLNRKNPIVSPAAFGTVSQAVDAVPWRGRDIRLRAGVRVEPASSRDSGHLWLRVDRETGGYGFFDDMSGRPITAPEWKSYAIEGSVDPDARAVAFGCFLKGKGRMQVDDFELAVKDDDGEWTPIPIKNPGFERGDRNRGPESWTHRVPQNIGYTIKLTEIDPYRGKLSLRIEKPPRYFTGSLFEKHPQVGDAVDREIAPGLFCRVPLALPGNGNPALGRGDRGELRALQDALKRLVPAEMTAEDPAVRVADVIIAWNVFQHFYPYFDVIQVDWDRALTRYLGEAIEDSGPQDFYATLSHMVAQLQDGHGNVAQWGRMEQAGPAFRVEWVEGRAVVTATTEPDRFQKGDIILSVDGRDAEKSLIQAEAYISGSPQWKRHRALGLFAFGPVGSTAVLKIRRGKEIIEVAAERNRRQAIQEFDRAPLEEVEDGIFYVDLDRADWPAIQARIQEIAAAKGAIFDLRGYPKGNHQVIAHLLTEKDTSDAWMRIAQVIYPDQEKVVGFQHLGWLIKPAQPHIQGKVVFITDGRAISYAESFLSFIEHYGLGEIVGGPTAGANGNVNPFDLPGGFRVVYTGMKVVKHDGSQHHTIGILPTVPVQRTLRGIRENRDELFDKALELAHIIDEDD
jgi:C-terminal processing protease CtpA/Prc